MTSRGVWAWANLAHQLGVLPDAGRGAAERSEQRPYDGRICLQPAGDLGFCREPTVAPLLSPRALAAG